MVTQLNTPQLMLLVFSATGMSNAICFVKYTGPYSDREIGMVSLRDCRIPRLPLTSIPVPGRNILKMLM